MFRDQLAHLSGRRKWNICRTLWRLAWEFYKFDYGWLLVGGRRYRAAGDGKIRLIDPSLPGRMLEHASALIASVNQHEEIKLRGAVRLRTAAHMAVLAELASRLSETALMDIPQLEWDGVDLYIITAQEHRQNPKGRS